MLSAMRSKAMPGEAVMDPADWKGSDLETDTRWLYRLKDEDIKALLGMAAQVRVKIGEDPNKLLEMGMTDFPLGSFQPTLYSIYSELKDGLGVALIRGLPAAELDFLDSAIIYWGIGHHLGRARSNNPEGDMLGHVTDLGKDQEDPETRGYQTRAAMDYHCDQSSIVGLFCVRTAREGGESKIASSIRVYNELLKRNPEQVKLLSEPLCWTKHGEVNAGEEGFYRSPVFSFLENKLCVAFGPRHIIKGHALPGVAPLTDGQLAAIRHAEEIAEEIHYPMQLEPGDMQFLNNYVTLHTRTSYTDWPDPAEKRLLWRLWLTSPELRASTDYVKQWDAGIVLHRTQEKIRL